MYTAWVARSALVAEGLEGRGLTVRTSQKGVKREKPLKTVRHPYNPLGYERFDRF